MRALLGLRSEYSLMWGVGSVKRLCRRAAESGCRWVGIGDVDNLYGLWGFLRAAESEGLEALVGSELTDAATRRRAVLVAKSDAGFSALCRLITRRKRDPVFDLGRDLPSEAGDLAVLTACPDLLGLWRDRVPDLTAALPRGMGPAAVAARTAAGRLGLPYAAWPANFFVAPEEHGQHLLRRAIGLNASVSRLKPAERAPADAYIASPAEYARRFSAAPEAVTQAERLAERIDYRGPPTDAIMPPWRDPYGRTADEVLRAAAFEGAKSVYGPDLSEVAVKRLEHELGTIERKGFSSYFLVVRDIIRRSPRICGRGSGAASLVAYVLGITNVCPLKHNLYFERFINADREDPPDIDVDFAWDERDDVIASVLDEFRGRSAMVSSHILFQPKMALRETAKVFGLPGSEIDALSRRLPWFWRGGSFASDMRTKLYEAPETSHLELPEPWPEIIGLAQGLVGAPRHLSVHPGGVVVTPGPIDNHVPLEDAPKGVPIVQWEKDAAEDAGLVKIDLLGNRSLAVIRDAVAEVMDNNADFDESGWEPEDDQATVDAVAEGRTMGCFYIESPAMRLLQRKTGRGDFEHLVIHSSIVRPAANDFIREYVRRLKGGRWEPLHPLLEDVLDETHGIMVYQEDVSKTAVVMAGFSHAEADGLRKIMSKKDKGQALADYRIKFEAGAGARGVSEGVVDAVWDMILSFGGYSFCKPHSASYARVSFQAAYLKTHHPAEFMAAVISNQGGFYNAFAYVSEAKRMGLTVLPPDVNLSGVGWSGRSDTVRVGLMAVKGLGRSTMDRVVDRRRAGPYTGFEDFYRRVRPAEDEAAALIQAGALDGLAPGDNRAVVRWRLAAARHGDRTAAAASDLFGPADLTAPPLPDEPEIERLRRQYRVLGFLPDRHPVTLFEDRLPAGRVRAESLTDSIGRRVTLAGWLLTGKLVKTKHGDPMQFLTFEDETDVFETTFFPRVYLRFCRILDWGRPYVLTGRVEADFGAVTVTVDRVQEVKP